MSLNQQPTSKPTEVGLHVATTAFFWVVHFGAWDAVSQATHMSTVGNVVAASLTTVVGWYLFLYEGGDPEEPLR